MLPVVLGPIITGVATGIMVQRYVLTPLGNIAVKRMGKAIEADSHQAKQMAWAAASGFFHGGGKQVVDECERVFQADLGVFGKRKSNGRKATKVVDQDGNIAS